jgi:hypothetical protein
MKTIRIPQQYVEVMLAFLKWELQLSEIGLLRNKHNEIVEPHDSPKYKHHRMLEEIVGVIEDLINHKKERRNVQMVFDWFDRRK